MAPQATSHRATLEPAAEELQYPQDPCHEGPSPDADIDALSDVSLAALNRLARYRPLPDPYPFPQGRAAVMVALFGSRNGEELNVLLSTRSTSMRTYPGNVALPGGKVDDGDMNIEATARREALEEVGLPTDPERVRFLTSLPPFLARSLLLVSPVICFITDYSIQPILNPSEVSNVFSLPLSCFLSSTPSTSPSMRNSLPPDVADGTSPFHAYHDYSWYDGAPHRFHQFATAPTAVTGLTAEILIRVAEVAYGRAPDFANRAPGQLTSEQLIARAIRDPRWSASRKAKTELDSQAENDAEEKRRKSAGQWKL